jgi:hypothetical protein
LCLENHGTYQPSDEDELHGAKLLHDEQTNFRQTMKKNMKQAAERTS